ncbi:hypothetical protein KOR42_10550 [Thalassoglobus neptunius]|uniref:Uncharacterized protein n=1 Tax=Thalassoglobus neptunius TaxID=1938619 RepID=A0A5C5X5T4_9PLAN|nr:hypothetical protein KOR42_10550 [Thalassoglobus neptunius]
MAKTLTYRMPIWFPCFLSALVAFALSIKPAMTLPTLPVESGLQEVSPVMAVLAFTVLGGLWGLVISCAIARKSNPQTSGKSGE